MLAPSIIVEYNLMRWSYRNFVRTTACIGDFGGHRKRVRAPSRLLRHRCVYFEEGRLLACFPKGTTMGAYGEKMEDTSGAERDYVMYEN